MGKVKSVIITVIVTLAVVVLLLFSVISCNLPGGVERYNSILSNIHLGSEFTGDTYTTILPDGVITSEQYVLSTPEDADEKAEYEAKYVQAGSYWIEKETLEDYIEDSQDIDDAEVQAKAVSALKADVSADAKILSDRFGEMEYTSYSVAVVDGIAIKVTVPSNLTYAAYKGNDNDAYTTELSNASTTISYLTLGGELTLRNSDGSITKSYHYEDYGSTGSLLGATEDISDYIKSVTAYSQSGTYAVKIKLTSAGEDKIYAISKRVANSDDTYIRFYIGTQNVINLTCEETIDDDTFYIQVSDYQTAKNYAALLNSAATGSPLALTYEYSDVMTSTSASGSNTALLAGIAVLIILVGLMAYLIARYRLLGLVTSLMIVMFALILVVALFFIESQLTAVGLFVALLCLMLYVGSSVCSYETIRKELSVGRTVQNAVKTGYRKTVAGILDLHIVLLFVGAFLSFIATGEAAACGIIIVICTLASYFLHWFGRFMWYVTMSPIKNEAGKRRYMGVKVKTFEEMEEEELERANKAKAAGEV